MKLPDGLLALLGEPSPCFLATLMPDGSPQVTQTWVDTDGEHVLLNSVGGRAWVRNLERDNRVTCNVINLANPYEFVEIRGRAEGPMREGADDHIHVLARKYLELDQYPWMDPSQPRLMFRVHPERVVHMHPGDPELESA